MDYIFSTSAYDCTFMKEEKTGTVTYVLDEGDDGKYEISVYREEMEKITATLQPINR